ncbi:MAG TPA: hypothetical protein VF462_04885 [Micromonosporaceae bacterium]
MSDFEPLLRDRFAGYRDALMAQIDAAGPEAVRHTVRRRRTAAVAAGAALAVVLVVAPIAAHAAFKHTAPRPAPADTAAPTSPAPAPTSELIPEPTVTPSDPPPPNRTPAAPDGRITSAQLLAARVDLPPWPPGYPSSCTTRQVRLHPPAEKYTDGPRLLSLDYGDVDADGATETVALIGCQAGEPIGKQVVAFDRDTVGEIVTLGRVVGTDDGFENILDVAVATDGSVRAQVADIQPCCGTPRYWPQTQWRTYGWDGESFRQIAGPTAFGPHPRATDLRVTSAKFILGPFDASGSGRRHGDLTVTISNEGPRDVAFVRVLIYIGGFPYGQDGGAWSTCATTIDMDCLLPGLAAGGRRTVTFGFRFEPGGPPATGVVRVSHYDADHLLWPDLAGDDNVEEFQLF